MKRILFSALIMLGALTSFAQTDELLPCGHNRALQRLKDSGFDPDSNEMRLKFLKEVSEMLPSDFGGSYQRGSQTIYTIPIVFHIIHANGPENISNAQIEDAVAILNRDFNKQNADTSVVVSQFAGIIANVGFEFKLPQYDALGDCTNGITRTYSQYTDGTNDFEAVKDVNRNLNNSQTNTSNLRFPRNKYLNIWVFKSLDGAAGYTFKPGQAPGSTYDGIFIQSGYVGSIGTGNTQTSRALTHECGHWFDLSHVWGNTNDPGVSCGNDGVTDTPITKGWSSCNINGKTCPSDPSPVDNVQNYMEYSYCSRMFTEGQKTQKMIPAINSSNGQRNQLWTVSNINSSGVNLPPVICKAEFRGDNLTICEGQTVDFEDMSYNGITTWNWTFTGGSPSSSTLQNPTVTYSTAGTYAVSLVAGNGSSTVSETKTAYITVLPATGVQTGPLMEGFETASSLPNNEWFVYNPDDATTWNVTSNAAYSGTKSVRLLNSSNSAGNLDEFISNTIDLSGMSSVVVTFKYAYAQKNSSSDDILKVYVSNDCGLTWTLRKQIGATSLATSGYQLSSFTPSSLTQWDEAQITNITTSYLTPNFRIKFSLESGGGNNVYIDDINISSALGTEEFEFNFNLAAYPNPFESNTTISFDMENNLDVSLELYDMIGKKVMDITNGNLNAGTHTYTINGDKLESGVYFVKLKAGNREQVIKIILQ